MRRPGRSAATWSDAVGARARAGFWRCPARRSIASAAGASAGLARPNDSSSIVSSNIRWQMSSCSSRAIRARSVSCAFSRRAAEVTVSLIAPAQLALAATQLLFRSSSSVPLNQQAGDEHRLRDENREARRGCRCW